MDKELSAELVWSLRALAQDAAAQRSLYPSFVVVTDELVSDFEEAYSFNNADFRARNSDLETLDRHIESKSGILEFWDDDALQHSEFWAEIRRQAREALRSRDLSVFAPHPSPATYATEDEVWVAGRPLREKQGDSVSAVISKLRNLFR